MGINPNTKQAYRLMHDGILALARAERQGIRVDLKYTEAKSKHLNRKIEKLETELKNSNFYKHWAHTTNGSPNINSNQQLSRLLYVTKKLKPTKTTTSGQGSTDEEALQGLNIPELNDLLEIRKLKKLRDTYLGAFIREEVNGFIHPFFNLHLVRTFRSSSDQPNFQNIPKRDKESMQIVRKALYPRVGHQLIEVDYGSLEVRIAACYHKDPKMLKYINDPTTDMHGDMAKQIYKLDKLDKKLPDHAFLRYAAKNGFVFPEFYGDYYKNCALALAGKLGELPDGKWKSTQGVAINGTTLGAHLISKGITCMDDFIEHLRKIEKHFWGTRFKQYAEWKNTWWQEYQDNGYVDMKTGFRCSGLMNKKDIINYPVQGAAFHCLLWSFIEVDKLIIKEKLDTKIIGQIHDAIILDVNPEELDYVIEKVKEITCKKLPEAWTWINVPLEVEVDIFPVDSSWATKL